MTGSSKYPFSDLTQTQVEQLIRAARVEQAHAVRAFLARLFHVRREREAQIWPPKNAPALSLSTHC